MHASFQRWLCTAKRGLAAPLKRNTKTIMDDARTVSFNGTDNRKFEAFAKDVGFQVRPCVAATPRTKGKIESQMKYLEEIRAYSGKLNLVELFELIGKINEYTAQDCAARPQILSGKTA